MIEPAPAAVAGGFEDPVFDAAAMFRALLDAFAHPGRVVPVPVDVGGFGDFNAGAAAAALTLLDADTPVWLSPGCAGTTVREAIDFHTGAPVVSDTNAARFAFLTAAEAAETVPRLAVGTADHPERSATAVVLVEGLRPGGSILLRGPGVEDASALTVEPEADGLWRVVAANARLFPLGVDFLLSAPANIAAVPRSTRVEVP